METLSFAKNASIKHKIIMLTVLVATITVVSSLFITLKNLRSELVDASKKEVTNIVEVVYDILGSYDAKVQSGTLSLKDAQQQAIAEVDKISYQGKNYVWITDYDDNMMAHPKLEGKSITDVADINGIRFFHDGVALAKEKGNGFVSYHWTKQGEDASKVFPKTSYFQSFPQWNWVIATGVYTDDIDKTVNQRLLQILLFNIITLVITIFIVIATIVKDIVKSMDKITEDLEESSKHVSSAASQLETASEKLAEGSAEQAASIQETSSTLEETSSMVQQNHENTKQAAALAKQSKAYAEKSHLEMEQMTSAMEELKRSSGEISKIIKVIDEIAFQTNILSLNAAVEAARAGDAGKGFAVVAEEVRSLAQRSAQAAKDTTVIIEKNINLSQTGVEITNAVQSSIMSINDQSRKVSELLDEISVATDEQSQGVSQINKAVSQMEAVINANAVTAEESSSASKALHAQTLNLNDIILSLERFVDGNNDKSTQIKYKQPKATTKVSVSASHRTPTRASKTESPKKLSAKDIIPLGDDIDNF